DVTLVRVCVGSKAAPMPVLTASGTATAESISTLTLGDKEKEIVRNRTMNNEAPNETPKAAPPQPSSRLQPPKSASGVSSAAAPTARATSNPQSAAGRSRAPEPAAAGSPGAAAAQRQAEREKAAVRRKVILAVGAVGLISIIAVAANSMMHPKASIATKAPSVAVAKSAHLQDTNLKKPDELSTKGIKPGTARSARRRAHGAKTEPEQTLRERTAAADSRAEEEQRHEQPESGERKRVQRERSPGGPKRSTGTNLIPGFKEEPAGNESSKIIEDSIKESN
ncbi:MAG TPA: hypothetical protein V6C69_08920, partial [Trichormus sp.]